MVRKPPSRSSIVLVLVLLSAFVAWTALTFRWTPLAALDARLLAPPVRLDSARGQIGSAFALLTQPGLIYLGLVALAVGAARRRRRQLAVGVALTVVLAAGSAELLKIVLGRPRPDQVLNLLSTYGSAYPSAHLAAAAAGALAVRANLTATRMGVRARLTWQVAAFTLILATAFDQWLMRSHYVSDLVGGLLLGGLAATTALLIAGVAVPVPQDLVTDLVRRPRPVEGTVSHRCAVIYNPARVLDWVAFRRHVEYELQSRGWQPALWLETTVDEPGHRLAARAVQEQVDLVLGAGGDGTIRVICDGLAGTGIPFGIIPAGTGNLLARNIGIPMDEGAALDVAFDGVDKAVDLIRLTVDDQPPEHFAVMAGIGIDAVIMQTTNPDLKRAVGSAAYFVSAAQNAKHPAMQATIQVDDEPAFHRRAHLFVVGNVGYLQANIQLIPDARPDDGLLNVLIASPRRPADWIRLTAQVLTRRRRDDEQLDRLTGRRVSISVETRDGYQMDGDNVGECRTMTAEVQPGALTLRVPRRTAGAERPAQTRPEPGHREQTVATTN
jgi:diacylglycerol kinase family enzyme